MYQNVPVLDENCVPHRIVDGVLNATMRSDIKEGSEHNVIEEINARMCFGIWHLPQWVLAKVKDTTH